MPQKETLSHITNAKVSQIHTYCHTHFLPWHQDVAPSMILIWLTLSSPCVAYFVCLLVWLTLCVSLCGLLCVFPCVAYTIRAAPSGKAGNYSVIHIRSFLYSISGGKPYKDIRVLVCVCVCVCLCALVSS